MSQLSVSEKLEAARAALNEGLWNAAEELIGPLLADRPELAEAWYIKARAAQFLDDLESADAAYGRACSCDPQDSKILYHYTKFLFDSQRYEKGHRLLSEWLPEGKFAAECRFLLGHFKMRLARFDEANKLFTELIASSNDPYDLHLRIGNALFQYRDVEGALDHWLKAHEAAPEESGALANIGRAYHIRKKYGLALIYTERALERDPDNVGALTTLGNLCFDHNKLWDALAAFQRAISLRPHDSSLFANSALCLFGLGSFDEAIDLAKKAIRMEKVGPYTVFACLSVLERSAAFEEFDFFLERIWDLLEEIPQDDRSAGFLNFLCLGRNSSDHKRTYDLHCSWGDFVSRRAVQNPIVRKAPASIGARGRSRIRLGILSSDLRQHVLAKFARPIFDHYDRMEFEVHCFSPFPGKADATQKYIMKRSNRFTEVYGKSPAEVAQEIVDQEIDLLLEFNGHTRFTSLESLAYRPAPVQICWFGYPFTSGLPEADYCLLDRKVAPGRHGHLRESALLMPDTWICMATSETRDSSIAGFNFHPVAERTPALSSGRVTFGTLNNPYKFSRELIGAWAKILDLVEDSVFLFVRTECASPCFRRNIQEEFSRHGLDINRIEFASTTATTHMNNYNRIDISLDSFPQTGGTTTCESLWMGCPVVSLVGHEIFERLSYSILETCGLRELVCFGTEEYIKVAVELARDAQRLRYYRENLRTMMLQSPICDGEGYVKSLEIVLKNEWRRIARFGV